MLETLFIPILLEIKEVYNLFWSDNIFMLFIISSLVNLTFILGFTMLGMKTNWGKIFFVKHNYSELPKNLKGQLELAINAPVNSANGICMWRFWGSIPLVIIAAICFNLNIYIMIIVTQIYIFLFCTDALDGIVARALDNESELGKILDPFTDKFLDLPILIVVCTYSGVPLFVFIAILIASFDILGTILRGKSKDPAATWVGKSKTIVKVITIIILSLAMFGLYLKYIGVILLTVTLILTYWSFYGKLSPKMRSDSLRFIRLYLYMNFKFIRNIFRTKKTA